MLKIQLCITGINCILKYIKTELKLYNISLFQYYCIFDQINEALVIIRDFFQNVLKLIHPSIHLFIRAMTLKNKSGCFITLQVNSLRRFAYICATLNKICDSCHDRHLCLPFSAFSSIHIFPMGL